VYCLIAKGIPSVCCPAPLGSPQRRNIIRIRKPFVILNINLNLIKPESPKNNINKNSNSNSSLESFHFDSG
jgi:hypothetical protein